MKGRKSFLKKASAIASGKGMGMVFATIRNMAVATLIGPDHYGVAFIFAITISLLEVMGVLAWDVLLVQAEDGNDPRLQQTAHTMMLLRGLLIAAVMLLLAGPMATYFSVPEYRWAFQCLALVPLIRGLDHLDYRRVQREYKYTPDILTTLLSQGTSLVVACSLAWWLRDARAMLFGVIAQSIAFTLVTHLVAERPYRLARDRDNMRRFLDFGWPLLINGILMYLIFQGDAWIIGGADCYSTADLGIFGIAVLLTRQPCSLVVATTHPMILPALAREQGNPERFQARYATCVQLLSAAAVFMTLVIITFAPPALAIYDVKYTDAGLYIGWLAIAQAARILRMAPTAAALARADTKNSMFANLYRLLALGLTVVFAYFELPLSWIAVSGIFGEMIAIVYTVRRLRGKCAIPMGMTFVPALGLLSLLGASQGLMFALPESLSLWAQLGIGAGITVVFGLGFILCFPSLRREIADYLEQRRGARAEP